MADEIKEPEKVIEPEKLMDIAMDKTIDVRKTLSNARLESVHIEDDIRQHVEFIRIKGYERMAEIKMLKTPESSCNHSNVSGRSSKAAIQVV